MGRIKNWRITKRETERFINEVWIAKEADKTSREERARAAAAAGGTHAAADHAAFAPSLPASAAPSPKTKGRGGGAGGSSKGAAAAKVEQAAAAAAAEDLGPASQKLGAFLYQHLHLKFGSHARIAEFGYNLIDALERYIDDSDCKLFLLILRGELAEEVRDDQLHLLVRVTTAMRREDESTNNLRSGQLSVPAFMRVLKRLLPTKSDTSFAKLQKVLQMDTQQKKTRMVDYASLLEEDADGNQGMFAEMVRDQHLTEIIHYSQHVVDVIGQVHEREGSNGKMTIPQLREALLLADPDKQRLEINSYLSRGCACELRSLDEREARHDEVDLVLFLENLTSGLLKKSSHSAVTAG